MPYYSSEAIYPGVAGKCFLVTGASSGIGRETAILLDALGATVIINGRDENRLAETRLRMKTGTHVIAPMDLREANSLVWLKSIFEDTGLRLSGIAHCAGTHAFAPLRAYSAPPLQTALFEHCVVTAGLFHAATRLKARAPECALVVMSSISSRFGITGNGPYGAARAAMESLCRSFAVEFACNGIRCNAVSGGFMEGSGMTMGGGKLLGEKAKSAIAEAYPLGLGHVSDAANALVFLLGSASRWITGTILPVDGGAGVKGV